jgi:phospholipid-binding lipoprotein MlaA
MFPSRLLLLLTVALLCSCSTTNPQDPLEPLNRSVYKFNDVLDRNVATPLAKGYNAVMPEFGKTAVRNFFSNLDDIVVTANDVLQLKIKQAASDAGRFVVNTTVGFLGLMDVASPAGLEKHHEDFGQTLGYWGVNSGPYLVLPLLGPSSLRDGIGDYADSYLGIWHNVNDVPARNSMEGVSMLKKRADLLDAEALVSDAILDRYSFIRDAYLQRRLSLVYDGNPPRPKYDDDDDEDEPPASTERADPAPTDAPSP